MPLGLVSALRLCCCLLDSEWRCATCQRRQDVSLDVRMPPRPFTVHPLKLYNRSYKSLAPKTRALLGVGLMVNAGLALQFSDQVESLLGLQPTSKDHDEVKKLLPTVTMVETDMGRQKVPLESRER